MTSIGAGVCRKGDSGCCDPAGHLEGSPSPSALVTKTAAREFQLTYGGINGRRWVITPDLNPPGSDFVINVEQGDDVALSFQTLPILGGHEGDASFDVDGLDAVADGQPSKGIHLYFTGSPESAWVKFHAEKAGIFPIQGRFSRRGDRSGYIIIREKRSARK